MIRERGFALLIVLWTMVLLALLMSQVMASSRIAVDLAANLRLAAQERAADDGAVQAAVFHLAAKGAAHWQPDGATRSLNIAGVPVTVQARSLGGMVNPNLASPALLAGLLKAVSVPAFQATTIATGIFVWRTPPANPAARAAAAAALSAYRGAGRAYGPPGTPFQSLAQLTNVLGMTPAIAARLAPYLSLFQPDDPDPKTAAPAVRAALAQAAGAVKAGGPGGAPVVDITACAAPGLCRHAVVSLSGTGATPFRLLQLN